MVTAPLARTLATVLPLAAGSALSPLVLVLQLRQLIDPRGGLRRAWAFCGGTALVVLIWLGLGLVLGQKLPERPPGHDPVGAAVHLALAAVLAWLGLLLLLRPEGSPPPATPHHGSAGSFRLGLLAMGSNWSSLALFIPAVQEVARAGLTAFDGGLLLLMPVGFTLLPAVAPALALLIGGQAARNGLERFGGWVNRHQRRINACLCFGFAALLSLNGLSRL